MKTITFCIDFDGTIVTHKYPEIGDPCPGALRVMKRIQNAGHRIIIHTMRSGTTAAEASEYLRKNGIEPWGFNKNPTQHKWTQSLKIFGNIYIDDAALGCPLIHTKGERSYVDWNSVEMMLLPHLGSDNAGCL